ARPSRVVDDRLDLAAMTHDPRVFQEARHVAIGEARHAVDVEPVKGRAEALTFGQDRAPAEPRLKPLQAQLLEQSSVVSDGEAPLAVVVVEKLRSGAAPAAAGLAVRADEAQAHVLRHSSNTISTLRMAPPPTTSPTP